MTEEQYKIILTTMAGELAMKMHTALRGGSSPNRVLELITNEPAFSDITKEMAKRIMEKVIEEMKYCDKHGWAWKNEV